MRVIFSLYHRSPSIPYVRVRRINKETFRMKLAKASFVNAARLVSNDKVIRVKVI